MPFHGKDGQSQSHRKDSLLHNTASGSLQTLDEAEECAAKTYELLD